MNGLALVTSPDAATVLVDLLAHGTEIDRRSAAILLVHQDPMISVPALIGALADADEVVRGNAHESLHAFARGRDFGQDAAAWQRWWQSRAI
jgi:HEAT repeat protein